MRGETKVSKDQGANKEFQSTLLMRGETKSMEDDGKLFYISIHSPHARRDRKDSPQIFKLYISIHSPHARRDREISSNIT